MWWGDINIPFDADKFDQLHQKMVQYLADKEMYVREAYAGANPDYQLKLRVVNELAWHNLFCYNMFLRPAEGADTSWTPDFSIICAPGFEADPAVDGTRQKNFAILNFTKKMILIGGTGYAGEMKKGIFGVLNYLLPHEHNTLSMHCSANVGQNGRHGRLLRPLGHRQNHPLGRPQPRPHRRRRARLDPGRGHLQLRGRLLRQGH